MSMGFLTATAKQILTPRICGFVRSRSRLIDAGRTGTGTIAAATDRDSDLKERFQAAVGGLRRKVVALDDDPTECRRFMTSAVLRAGI